MAELMQYLTPVIAVAAFILSAIIWIERLLSRKPRLEIYAACKKFEQDLWHSEGCELKANNTGFVDITLSSYYFEVITELQQPGSGGKPQILTRLCHVWGAHLPHKLCARESCMVFVPGRRMAEELLEKGYRGLVELRGCYEDQLGREYKSKRFQFDMNRWAKTPERVDYPPVTFL